MVLRLGDLVLEIRAERKRSTTLTAHPAKRSRRRVASNAALSISKGAGLGPGCDHRLQLI
jgi:hypothetical protein